MVVVEVVVDVVAVRLVQHLYMCYVYDDDDDESTRQAITSLCGRQ